MRKVELFFFPTSFYSQRARLSLEEKHVSYKETIVSLAHGEQNQPWFLRMNPNGEVPTIKIGDECFGESERIVDVVDTLPSDSEHKLVPDLATLDGKLVSHWRQKIDAVEVGKVTYGVMANHELSPGGIGSVPAALRKTREGLLAHHEASIQTLEAKKVKNPELKESYERKIRSVKDRLFAMSDKNIIGQILNDLDPLMDDIEEQLRKTSSEHGGEFWLCGGSFTAADINLCVLLGRFSLLGLLPRFADPKRYPSVVEYWTRAQARPTVQKVVLNNMAEAKRFFIMKKIRSCTGLAVGVGVVALAVWLAHRHIAKK